MSLPFRIVSRHLQAKGLDLKHWGLEGIVHGQPVTLYHGTTRLFHKFDPSLVREELVNKYYGSGIFLTPSKRVAESYASANRNMGLPPSIIEDLKRKNANAGAFMQMLYTRGNDAWDDLTPEKLGVTPGEGFLEAVQKYSGGVDPNTIADVCRFIEGSKLVSERSEENEPINIFNMSTGLPDWVYQSLNEIGLDSKTYRPKVYTVRVTVHNPLVTTSSSAARSAKSKGYDSVVFYGRDLVNGVPEVAVFNPSLVKVTGIEIV